MPSRKRKSAAKPDHFVGDRVEFQLQRGPYKGEWAPGVVVARVAEDLPATDFRPDGLGFAANISGAMMRDHLSFLIRRDGCQPSKSVYWPPVDAIRRVK